MGLSSRVTTSAEELVFQPSGKSPRSVVEKSSSAITFAPGTKSNLEYTFRFCGSAVLELGAFVLALGAFVLELLPAGWVSSEDSFSFSRISSSSFPSSDFFFLSFFLKIFPIPSSTLSKPLLMPWSMRLFTRPSTLRSVVRLGFSTRI